MRRTTIPFLTLLHACGPSVAVTTTGNDDTTTDDDDDDDDGTLDDTAPQTDPTAGTITFTSGEVTSGGSQESDGSDEVTSAGDPFISKSDGSLGWECDLWRDDCPRGEKCMPWANDGGSSWNSTRCSPLAEDPNDVGEPCTVEDSAVSGIDDCGPRAMCWNVDSDTLMGECVGFCGGSEANPTCTEPCTTCPISGDGVLILCLPVCDPLAPTCDEGEGCYPTHQTFICIPDAGGDMGGLGEPCEYINVCDPGLFCANAGTVPDCEGGTGCCAPFCNPLVADPCPAMPEGVECIPLDEEGEEGCVAGPVGGCLLPE